MSIISTGSALESTHSVLPAQNEKVEPDRTRQHQNCKQGTMAQAQAAALQKRLSSGATVARGSAYGARPRARTKQTARNRPQSLKAPRKHPVDGTRATRALLSASTVQALKALHEQAEQAVPTYLQFVKGTMKEERHEDQNYDVQEVSFPPPRAHPFNVLVPHRSSCDLQVLNVDVRMRETMVLDGQESNIEEVALVRWNESTEAPQWVGIR